MLAEQLKYLNDNELLSFLENPGGSGVTPRMFAEEKLRRSRREREHPATEGARGYAEPRPYIA